MKTINVDNIPEPVVRAMETVVETLREQFHDLQQPRHQVELPIWPGKVIGSLNRTEVYQDVGLRSSVGCHEKPSGSDFQYQL